MFNIRTKISGETGLATAESPMQRNICPVHVSSIDIEMKRILGSWAGERNTHPLCTVQEKYFSCSMIVQSSDTVLHPMNITPRQGTGEIIQLTLEDGGIEW